MAHINEVFPSVLAEVLLKVGGNPPDFNKFKTSRDVMDVSKKNLILKCGRQTSKSSTIALSTIIDLKRIPGFRVGYIAPSARASTAFSILRFSDIMLNSPMIWKDFYSIKANKGVIDNVGLKKFSNNSLVVFLYADVDPDRIRGFTFDRLIFDEVQDIDLDNVVPVAQACIMNSQYREKMLAGTPKSLDNDIELIWGNSTQNEWAVKCEACGKYNIFVSRKTIGKDGPICAYCGKYIDTRKGQYVPMQPGKPVDGYHISRTALPFYMYHKDAWQEIVQTMEDPLWSKEKFDNEILGISSGTGFKLITEKDLKDISTENIDPYNENSLNTPGEKFIGIDWGGGDYSLKSENVQSQTAIVVYVLNASKLTVCYYNTFTGMGPIDILGKIQALIAKIKPLSVSADAAGGKIENAQLLKQCINSNIRFFPIQWGSYSKPIEWNNVNMYLADKTTMFDLFFNDILKKELIRLPSVNNKQIISEFLSEHAEVSTSTSGKKIWKRMPNKTDDLLHAAVFGWIGFRNVKGYSFVVPA